MAWHSRSQHSTSGVLCVLSMYICIYICVSRVCISRAQLAINSLLLLNMTTRKSARRVPPLTNPFQKADLLRRRIDYVLSTPMSPWQCFVGCGGCGFKRRLRKCRLRNALQRWSPPSHRPKLVYHFRPFLICRQRTLLLGTCSHIEAVASHCLEYFVLISAPASGGGGAGARARQQNRRPDKQYQTQRHSEKNYVMVPYMGQS
jgi:hypothetical protein